MEYNEGHFNGYNSLNNQELRALQADDDPAGGYLTLPTEVAKQVLTKKKNRVFVRQFATTFEVPLAQSLGVPTLDSDPGSYSLDWTAEIGQAAEDTEMDFQARDLHPHHLKRLVKVSNRLMRMSNVSDLVTDRLAYVFSIVEEFNFLQGHGSNRPLGIFQVSNIIGTDRDCPTDNTATAIKADNLIECEGMLKEAYRANARWVFSRAALKRIRKLKDGEGNFLWTQGFQGSPSTILDYPYHISEYCPATFEANQYVGALADWSHYFIADSLDMRVQILRELYARTSQTGFMAELEADGMPVLDEAFVRVTMGA